MKIKYFVRLPFTFILLMVILILISGCSSNNKDQFDKDYDSKIDNLKNQIDAMNKEQNKIESGYKEKIDALESQLSELEENYSEIESDIEKESEATVKKEFFGFIYKEENKTISIVSYEGNTSEVIIPASINGMKVTKICDSAFENSEISSVSFPDTVKTIGWFAFKNCPKLKIAVLPESVEEIGYQAFFGCDALTIYTKSDSYSEKYAKSYGIKLSLS